ncbi:MAG: Type II secretion system protein G precursor [bacterium ADurb.Bin429]|nr:MAG: Type II secretion system protein G precursor [bacterium ADurb.Bin429]
MSLNRTHRARRGFTLLELLVVMFILVLLAGTVTALVMKRTEDAKHARAKADIASFETAIDLYKLDNQAYPPSLEALRAKPSGDELPNWNGPYVKKAVPADPWGRAYLYQAPGEHNQDSYDLFSLGKDGQEGGAGNDADILNWD